MRKVWLLLSLLAIVVLAACSASSTAIPVVTEGAKVTPTTAQQASQPSQAPAATSGPATCTVKSTLPTLSPTETARFAPITDKDWSIGPANAKVTLLEYSDYM